MDASDTTSARRRRDRADALQAEADAVVSELGLDGPLLGAVGEPHRVGSSRLGLMVWRDIDITVVCQRLDVVVVSDLAGTLLRRGDVREVTLRSEVGRLNTDPATYPDGLYLQVRYAPAHREEWKLDVWFVDEPERQPDLRHVRSLPALLTEQARDAVLAVKEHWAARSEYGTSVTSADVYRAVLEDGVGDVTGFDAWLASRPAGRR